MKSINRTTGIIFKKMISDKFLTQTLLYASSFHLLGCCGGVVNTVPETFILSHLNGERTQIERFVKTERNLGIITVSGR